MKKAPRPMANRVAEKFQDKTAMSVILRNVASHNWGWFSREEGRMHLQTVGRDDLKGPKRVKVWLENKGKRACFLADGDLSGPELKKLQTKVAADREEIEVHWICFMIENKWLKAELKGSDIILTAYPGTHNSFTRTIDLREEFPGAYSDTIVRSWEEYPPEVDLDSEICAISVGHSKNKDHHNHILLSKWVFED